MNKRIILSLVVIGVLGLLSYLGFSIVSKTKAKNAIAKQLESIPEFELLTLDKKIGRAHV